MSGPPSSFPPPPLGFPSPPFGAPPPGPGGVPPAPPNPFIGIPQSLVQILLVFRDYLIVMVAVLVWDSLCTLNLERKFIWRARWTPLKVAYLINRYWTLALACITTVLIQTNVPVHICLKIARIEPGGIVLTIMACAAILTIRVWAIVSRAVHFENDFLISSQYERCYYILAFLVSLMLAEFIVLCLAVIQFSRACVCAGGSKLTTSPAVSLPSNLPGCVTAGKPGSRGWAVAFWAAPLLFDTVIILLTVHRILYYRRVAAFIPVLSVFGKDGGLYYMVIFTVDLINILFFAQRIQALQSINSAASLVLTSLMVRPTPRATLLSMRQASRIVLNLHQSNHLASNSSGNGQFTERDERYLASFSAPESPQTNKSSIAGRLQEGDTMPGTAASEEWGRRGFKAPGSDDGMTGREKGDIEMGGRTSNASSIQESGIRVSRPTTVVELAVSDLRPQVDREVVQTISDRRGTPIAPPFDVRSLAALRPF